MTDRIEAHDGASPTFVVRNLEELIAMAQASESSTIGADRVELSELSELDSIRLMREFVLDTTGDRWLYSSGT